MPLIFLISAVISLLLFLPPEADAGVRLYSGTLEVITTSGKACAGRKGLHQISLVIGNDDIQEPVFGYLGGDTVTVGQLRGASLDAMSLRYPYVDSERAEGNILRVEISGMVMRGELHDRHLDASVDDCNFDFARVKLIQIENEQVATEAYQHLSLQYEAQLARSTAISISRSGAHSEAVPVFENALALADKLYPPDSVRLHPYLTSLANSYMRTGQYLEFAHLYAARIPSLSDEGVRQIFGHHQIRSLVQIGRSALVREDYQTALDHFRQALKIDYKNKDAIAATMSALVRSGRHDEAIKFLEETEQKLDSEPDRKDVREAIALVAYQKARKALKAGQATEAERDLRKAISLDPGTAYYLVVLSRWLHKAGKYPEADAVLKRGIESFKDEHRRLELTEAREKLRLTERILAKIRRAGT